MIGKPNGSTRPKEQKKRDRFDENVRGTQKAFDKVLEGLSLAEKIRRRHFNDAERLALYIAAGGLCEECGIKLEDGFWEPDHIHPYHAGGNTDVANGRAICRHCNRVKGGRHNG